MHTQRELEIVKYWEEHKTFEKSVEERPQNKQYVFYDGPPFATGFPHYGHILALTSKDLFPRFWTMKGYRVERKWGWDCHGLPIENIAEKELGIKDKSQIQKMGIEQFNETCRKKVLSYVEEWKKTVKRMGKWIDIDNSYKTMDNTYMETIWYIFKKLHDEKMIYEGKKILMYCPRCETPLANAEIAMDESYKDVTETTITAKFKIVGKQNEYILAWTTTPWTLIGNVALAVNEKLDYVKIKVGAEYLILAKERLVEVKDKYEIVEEFKGEKLLKVEYEPLYKLTDNNTNKKQKAYYVINGGDAVTSEDGTGIVHMAIYGEFDYEMIKKYNLPIIQHIGDDGKLSYGKEEWKGMWFKKLDPEVITDLRNRGLLFSEKDYTHSYPFCYRCATPLFYNAMDSWFVNIQKIKPKLIKKRTEIDWKPENIEARFKYNVETAPDWNISRNRFWATSIPVWKCDACKNKEVIGSIAELKEKAIEKVEDNLDLHKHVVDKIHIKCKCGQIMNRIPEVFDCWFESGSMPFASKHYPFENETWYTENYPADFISEYVGQLRTWFYYMFVLGILLKNKSSFKHVAVTGTILAADGSKMSKSKNNYPDPNKIFEKYGADALRFYLMSTPVMRAQDLNFKEESVDEIYKKTIMILSNVKNFYALFAENNTKYDFQNSKNILDRWIVSKTNKLVENVTKHLENYDTVNACSEITDYITELSTWYVRRTRDRTKSENKKEREDAIKTLAYSLMTCAKVIAPIMPFLAEDIYLMFKQKDASLGESIHLESWPKSSQKKINEELHNQMQKVREIITVALDLREKSKVPIRQALKKVTIQGIKFEEEYSSVIKDELNVKEVEYKDGTEIKIELDTVLTEELIEEGISRDLIRKINQIRKENNLTPKDRIILYIETSPEIIKAVNSFKKEIKHATQADEIKFNDTIEKMNEIQVMRKEEKVKTRIGIKKNF